MGQMVAFATVFNDHAIICSQFNISLPMLCIQLINTKCTGKAKVESVESYSVTWSKCLKTLKLSIPTLWSITFLIGLNYSQQVFVQTVLAQENFTNIND